MSNEGADRVTDAASHVEARFTLVQGANGGAAAVSVELTNTAASGDVLLNVNSALSAFVTLTVTDGQGGVLSKAGRKFSSAERQRFDVVRLGPGQGRRWRVPLGEQLDASALPDGRLQGRLVVNVLLQFRRLRTGEQPGEGDFESSILTLSDMDVTFTRAALSEGASPSRNGH